MKYAIISINKKQYKVEEGSELLIDRIDEKEIEPTVMLYVDEKKSVFGDPVIKNAKVKFEHLGEINGKKLHVRKFKAKSRYRRKIGFRPKYSKIKVKSIKV